MLITKDKDTKEYSTVAYYSKLLIANMMQSMCKPCMTAPESVVFRKDLAINNRTAETKILYIVI